MSALQSIERRRPELPPATGEEPEFLAAMEILRSFARDRARFFVFQVKDDVAAPDFRAGDIVVVDKHDPAHCAGAYDFVAGYHYLFFWEKWPTFISATSGAKLYFCPSIYRVAPMVDGTVRLLDGQNATADAVPFAEANAACIGRIVGSFRIHGQERLETEEAA